MPMYPEPERDLLIAFIYHTLRLDRIPTGKDVIEKTLGKPNDPSTDPYVAGQAKSVALIFQIAEDENLLPKVNSVFDLDTKLPWLKRLHRNLMKNVAELGAKVLDGNLIQIGQVGEYRQTFQRTQSPFGTIEAPPPHHVRELLVKWANDLHNFEQQHLHAIRGASLDFDTAEELVEKAEEASLRLAAIKPFEDGNNAAARLVENLLRLHWGLPWKVIPESTRDEYAEKLREQMKNL